MRRPAILDGRISILEYVFVLFMTACIVAWLCQAGLAAWGVGQDTGTQTWAYLHSAALSARVAWDVLSVKESVMDSGT